MSEVHNLSTGTSFSTVPNLSVPTMFSVCPTLHGAFQNTVQIVVKYYIVFSKYTLILYLLQSSADVLFKKNEKNLQIAVYPIYANIATCFSTTQWAQLFSLPCILA